MEMKTYIYSAVAGILVLASCSQEGPGAGAAGEYGDRIYFRSYLPTVTKTRAGIISKENLSECQVTGFNPDDENRIDSETGKIEPLFGDIRYEKDAAGHFIPNETDACTWPDSQSTLHFFAYYPSAESMREKIDSEKFKFVNNSKKAEDDTYALEYRLENFKVAQDIADQVDFIAAYSNGTAQKNGRSGIDLNFSHQLARVEISAWGESNKYDFEIAGVRIGNAFTEGDFSFSSLMSESGGDAAWQNTEGKQSPVEHIFSKGESTVMVSKTGEIASSSGNAASIMGNSGPAMVIPMAGKIEAWEGKGYSAAGKLYFSVLLRVINKDGDTVYPYPNDKAGIPVVYLAFGEEGTIKERLYLKDGEYYTQDSENEEYKYTPSDTEEVRGFCWASLPVAAKWEAGKIYTYKLNYTNGIGWQDPKDPNPGEPIIERGSVPFEVDVAEWLPAEDYDSDIEVPKK